MCRVYAPFNRFIYLFGHDHGGVVCSINSLSSRLDTHIPVFIHCLQQFVFPVFSMKWKSPRLLYTLYNTHTHTDALTYTHTMGLSCSHTHCVRFCVCRCHFVIRWHSRPYKLYTKYKLKVTKKKFSFFLLPLVVVVVGHFNTPNSVYTQVSTQFTYRNIFHIQYYLYFFFVGRPYSFFLFFLIHFVRHTRTHATRNYGQIVTIEM